MGIPAAIAAMGWSNVDRRRISVRRIERGELLCAGCEHGQAVMGFPDRRRHIGESCELHGGWKAARRDRGGKCAVCVWAVGAWPGDATRSATECDGMFLRGVFVSNRSEVLPEPASPSRKAILGI